MNGLDFFNSQATLIALWFIALLWTFFWKGLGLYKSARQKQNIWFIALLILNTLGLLEIAYLFFFSKEKLTFDQLKNYFSLENIKSLTKKDKKIR